MMLRHALRSIGARGVAAVLALAVPVFCLLGVAPMATAAAADPGCQGDDGSAKLCAQSAPSEPLPGVLLPDTPVQRAESPTGWLSSTTPPCPVLPFHAAPAMPRAPPGSLA
jgi:hypothetical protein